MTDQTMPADPVREIVKKMHHHANQEHVRRDAEQYFRFFAKQLDALLPPPPRPTLADMTDEERAACQWMQADAGDPQNPVVICRPEDGALVLVMTKRGTVARLAAQDVTPCPDLPRLTWPGDTPAPATVPPNILAVGSEWDDVDAMAMACRESGRDQIIVLGCFGHAYVWSEVAEWWEVSRPRSDSAPFTVLHIGKEADQ